MLSSHTYGFNIFDMSVVSILFNVFFSLVLFPFFFPLSPKRDSVLDSWCSILLQTFGALQCKNPHLSFEITKGPKHEKSISSTKLDC